MYGLVSTLKRPSLTAAHSMKIKPMSHPVLMTNDAIAWCISEVGLSIRKYIKRPGARPKDTLSAKESNSLPKSESLPLALATRPSKASQKNDINMQRIASI